MRYTYAIFALALLAGCTTEPAPPPKGGESMTATPVTNRIDIPAEVRRNLGITFVKAESRHVAQTLRVPGVFEPAPGARRVYAGALPGRVTLLVSEAATVETGTPLFRIDAPTWHETRRDLLAAQAELQAAGNAHKESEAELAALQGRIALLPARLEALKPMLAAYDTHLETLLAASALWQARVTELEDLNKAGGGRAAELAAARSELKAAESAIAEEREKKLELEREQIELGTSAEELRLELPVLQARVSAARADEVSREKQFEAALAHAAALLGTTAEKLAENDAWLAAEGVTLAALGPGVVRHIEVSNGQWLEAGATVLDVLDMSRLRFTGRALQADLGRIKPGQDATVVAPIGGSLQGAPVMQGKLRIAPHADAESRTVALYIELEAAPWARPGVTAEAEIVVDATAMAELAVPVRCVIRDGLDDVIFVRDSKDPDKVIREKVETGVSDGRWIVLFHGVGPGDEVVLDGVYELKLTGAGKPTGKGHFHADGTWHEGDDH